MNFPSLLKPFLACSLWTLVLGLVSPASSATIPAGDELRILADSVTYDKGQDRYEAVGNVLFHWDGAILNADRAVVGARSGEAVAEGNVTLRHNGDHLKSERLTINYLSQQGEIEKGDLFVSQGNFHLRGDRFSKTGEASYRAKRASFTTCDGPSPSWRFTATDLDVTLDEFAQGKNAVFYVGPVPLFYTPYILFPVKRERQSGFLFPHVGSSVRKGFTFDIPYYWAISPSQDATFDLDVQTKRGVGLGTEYRYLGRHQSDGTMQGYLIYDRSREKWRGELTVRQRDALSPTIDFKSDVHLVLDRDYYRDFGEAAGEYNRQLLDTSLSVGKRWDSATLTGEVRYFEDLYAATNDATLQRFPTLTGSVIGGRLGRLPLYGGVTAEFTHFHRQVGLMGERVDIHPTLAYYLPGNGPLQLSLRGGYRQRFYQSSGDASAAGYQSKGLVEGGATVSSLLDRVYTVQWGDLKRLRHTLLPEVRYDYAEARGQDALPFFDYNDRVPGGSLVSWALTSYVTGKLQHDDALPDYRDLLFFRLSQGYQVAGGRRDLLTLVDEGRQLTDLRAEARLTPVDGFSLAVDSRYNTHDSRFSAATVGMELMDRSGNLLGLGYRSIIGTVESLDAKLGLTLVKPFAFNYTGRYSIQGGAFLESLYSLEYKHQCWSVLLTYRDRSQVREQEFLVNFTLAGVGALGRIKAF